MITNTLPSLDVSATEVRPGSVDHFINLTMALVVREFKGQYRRTLFGPAWVVLQPLAYMVVFIFLRGLFDIPSQGVPFAVFTFSALTFWTFFSNAVTRCAPSIQANAGILKKINIPREIFPVAAVIASLADLLIALAMLGAMLVYFQIPVGWNLLWTLPLVLLTALLALGIGLAAAAIGTYKRDILFAIPFLMQFWLLATPILYPVQQVPKQWLFLFSLNPMVGLIEGFRNAIVHNLAPDPTLISYSIAGVALIWLVAWPLFRAVSGYFADVL